jgi:hypothetical protein
MSTFSASAMVGVKSICCVMLVEVLRRGHCGEILRGSFRVPYSMAGLGGA